MAVSVKRITLWRADVENRPGVLANALEPLARAGADLRVVMGYRFPTTPEHAAIEVYPVSGRKAAAAAQEAGLAQAVDIPCLFVEGDNRPGMGASIARGLADASINVAFLVAQVLGRRFSATLGFDDEHGADQAVRIIRQAAATPARRPQRKRPIRRRRS